MTDSEATTRTSLPPPRPGVDVRAGRKPSQLERAVLDHLYYTCSKDLSSATALDVYRAMAHATRDRLVHRWIMTKRHYSAERVKRAYYLSAEFLLGRFLGDNLAKLGLMEQAREGLAGYDLDLDRILAQEPDPGIGNGGLGRLAACFLDSMATLGLPGYGYGLRYQYGIFEQRIEDGWQKELPDDWAQQGNPWEIPKYEYKVLVHFGGEVLHHQKDGQSRVEWVPAETVIGVPYDMPIAGEGASTVNTLRLWSAEAPKEFDLEVFNAGDYRAAVDQSTMVESISKVLYPPDDTLEGKELRLRQQYFFVACSISDIFRRFDKEHDSLDVLPDYVSLQLNDTHPSIAVAELMRVLMDDRGLKWERAWDLTQRTIAFTNHTLLAEALEKWRVDMFQRLLPRHLEIIYEINARFMTEVRLRWPREPERLERMSLVQESPERMLRMAHLAVVGSHSVNGVAALHSRLLREHVMRDFAELYPERFNNKTNGVTPRRFVRLANPGLAALLNETLGGDAWVRDLELVRGLEKHADDDAFLERIRSIKRQNKERVGAMVHKVLGLDVDPESIFDTQIKRIHEYKRQLLNVLHIVHLYWSIKDEPGLDVWPRVFLFGGKAAPGYQAAKLIIKLIHDVAAVVNRDPAMKGRLRVAYIPNYGVSAAETLIPGTDVSEQISMAGKEASGTGNMKFAMNGALTLGTLDGANIEIREEVGPENFFLFGLTADEVRTLDREGYHPAEYIARSPNLQRSLESIEQGFFSPYETDRFALLTRELRGVDRYKHCADFDAYVQGHQAVEAVYRDPREWSRRALFNIARVGKFSSDRTIREYASEIWKVDPVEVPDVELP
jgi:starch phosphorylase